ncbi:uncharacterized protein LOC119005007 isoform X2 [Acanthopagrus latus]|uniref:uncharacterized protein LOC119005007 isoform X2 n=1 Tax=Acanthopagrus latus TaxID=8177 RepID=UPI00187CB062|nr:uncharacterized protein LOC119005007 isoform X2 [Acanthopagrus latus]
MWKLSSRPCQNQYPLKKEAVDGIKPVHEALHKGGVIVSCENSPVRTPIFPVKKIKPVGQPDEWREACVADTVALLSHLADNGHKASLSKLQFVCEEVVFLGHVITREGKTLSPSRIAAIQSIPRPLTKKQVMSFLGMTSYCRQWILNYAEIEAPLAAIAHGKGLNANDKVEWTTDADKAFTDLKLALQSPPTLGLPDCSQPFTETVDEKADDGEAHDCVAIINEVCSPRSDLQEVPLQNADLELFVDGSASRDPGTGKNQTDQGRSACPSSPQTA